MTREKLRQYLDGWYERYHDDTEETEEHYDALNEIRALIEQGRPRDPDETLAKLLERLGIDFAVGKLIYERGYYAGRMDVAATKEFIEKWTKQWMQDDADFIRRELVKMIRALGAEIAEDKGNAEGGH